MGAVFPVAAGLVSVLVLSLYDRLTVFWLGRSVPGIAPILFLVVAGNAIAVILTGSGTSICKGVGKLEIETIYVVTGLILNIILTITLVLAVGAIGTVIASTVSWSIGAVLCPVAASAVRLAAQGDIPQCWGIALCRGSGGRCESLDAGLHSEL